MVTKRTIFVLGLLVGLAPVTAQARIAALLPRSGGNPQISAEVRAQIEQAVVEAMREDEWDVLGPAETAQRIPATLRVCAPEASCAIDVRDAIDAEVVVGIRILGTDVHPEMAARISVTLTGIDGIGYEGSIEVVESATAAAREAVRAALARRALGAGPFLTVRGTPGATCSVDGEDVGQVPTTVRVEAGSHTVTVRLVGHQAQTRTVTVRADALAREEIEITLAPDVEPLVTRSEPAWAANLLLGGALVGAAAGFAISPIMTLATLGQCAEPVPGGCIATVQFGAQSGILLGVAGALLVAGVIVMITQPFQVTVTTRGGSGAMILLDGRF
jgi:hypothetical protein